MKPRTRSLTCNLMKIIFSIFKINIGHTKLCEISIRLYVEVLFWMSTFNLECLPLIGGGGLLDTAWVGVRGCKCPPSDQPKTLWKTNNVLGKVKKFRTFRPLLSWINSCLKKVQAQSSHPPPLGLRLLRHVTTYMGHRLSTNSMKTHAWMWDPQ